MSKKRATFNLSEKLLERLDNLPRKLLPNKSHLVEELLEKWLEETVEHINIFIIFNYVTGIAFLLIVANHTKTLFPSFSEGIIIAATRAAGEIVTLTFFVALIPIGALTLRALLSVLYFGLDTLQMIVEYRKQDQEENQK